MNIKKLLKYLLVDEFKEIIEMAYNDSFDEIKYSAKSQDEFSHKCAGIKTLRDKLFKLLDDVKN